MLVVTVAGGVPTAYLIAIFRYGLWDLDVVIKKTVIFALVVVLLMATRWRRRRARRRSSPGESCTRFLR